MNSDNILSSPRAPSAGTGEILHDAETVLRPHLPRLLRHCAGLREQASLVQVCGSWRAEAVGQKLDLFDPGAAKTHFEAAVVARNSQPGALRAALSQFSRGLPPFVAVRLTLPMSSHWQRETDALQELGSRANRCVSLALFAQFCRGYEQKIDLPIWDHWVGLRALTLGSPAVKIVVDLSPLESLSSLTCLRLERIIIPPIKLPPSGAFLPSLKNLRMRYCKQKGGTGGLSVFPEKMLQHLRQLELSTCSMMKVVEIYPRLTELRVEDDDHSEIGPGSLQDSFFPELRVLSLFGCRRMTALPRVLPLLTNLRELDIRQTEIRVDTSQLSPALQQQLSELEVFQYEPTRSAPEAP